MDERTKRTVFLIVGGILEYGVWWVPYLFSPFVPSAGETPAWVWLIILSTILSFIGTVFWFWGCYLWVKLKNRHWAFTFLGFLSLIGILIISSLDDRSDKAAREEPAEVVKETKETPSQALLEAVAKQLKPRYCEKCGSQLEIRKVEPRGFDKDTGYPKYDAVLACPYATIYETAVLPRAKITWKGQFGGHTVDKASVVVHLKGKGRVRHKPSPSGKPRIPSTDIKKPIVGHVPEGWYVNEDSSYAIGEYESSSGTRLGLIEYIGSTGTKAVQIYYGEVPEQLKGKENNGVALTERAILEADMSSPTESGTMTVGGQLAGYAKTYNTKDDIYEATIVFVKGSTYIEISSYYTSTQEGEAQVMSLINSIDLQY